MVPNPAIRLIRMLLVALLATAATVASATAARADSVRDQQWHLDKLDIAEAHRITRGAGVTVAVVDSGADSQHPDLAGALTEGKSFGGGGGDGWDDEKGHGTGMATLIAGRGHGVANRDGVLGIAPEASITPVRVGSHERSENRAVELGVEWAVEHDADVVNLSLGGGVAPDLAGILDRAWEKGIIVVAAVGNTDGGASDVSPLATYPGVIAVSGTNEEGGFSVTSAKGPEVVLAAPATDIVVGDIKKRGLYSTGTGTSNATAIVSGVVALVKAKYPDLDAANIINRLIATADDKGPEGRDDEYGFGVVNPVKALTADVPEVKANPLLPGSASSGTTHQAGEDPSGVTGTTIALGALGGVVALGILVAAVVLLRRRRTPIG
ncbi:MAG: S8 family serine peptidase [Micromonosporaceae bacterium]